MEISKIINVRWVSLPDVDKIKFYIQAEGRQQGISRGFSKFSRNKSLRNQEKLVIADKIVEDIKSIFEAGENFLKNSENLQMAEVARQDDYYRAAFECYKIAGERGNSEALREAGYMVAYGFVRSNGTSAAEYFEKAISLNPRDYLAIVGFAQQIVAGNVPGKTNINAIKLFEGAIELGKELGSDTSVAVNDLECVITDMLEDAEKKGDQLKQLEMRELLEKHRETFEELNERLCLEEQGKNTPSINM